jgi:DNA-binding GntR family transcriptional regulator
LTPRAAGRTIAFRMAERTQAETAYQQLSHRIMILEIPPDERIVEEFWAQKLGVNRSGIREALTRLLGEGLVRQGERGGFFVNEMSDEEIHHVREVREILESAAFTLACDRATSAQISALAETCDDFSSFVKKGYFTAAHEADLRFHHLLISASGNPRLSLLYERSRIPLFHRKVTRSRSQPEQFNLTDKEHRAILEALRKRDKKKGVEQLLAHFNRGERDALE